MKRQRRQSRGVTMISKAANPRATAPHRSNEYLSSEVCPQLISVFGLQAVGSLIALLIDTTRVS